ncbi:tyrosine-type recombinase/integrase [Kitasatospora sp. NPDC004614]|uniref:tyrosine-type recombinase/integrase n=1 Tax=unclassified Kitasatospora TaxID=2633591 RepID=UPI00367EF953
MPGSNHSASRRTHDLRHGAASLALTGGCDLKVIQAQLGHSTIITTADTYTSVLPQTAHNGAEDTARVVIDAARTISRSIRHQPKRRHRRTNPHSATHTAARTPLAA